MMHLALSILGQHSAPTSLHDAATDCVTSLLARLEREASLVKLQYCLTVLWNRNDVLRFPVPTPESFGSVSGSGCGSRSGSRPYLAQLKNILLQILAFLMLGFRSSIVSHKAVISFMYRSVPLGTLQFPVDFL